MAGYADILQIGTRNMQNFALLEAAGETGQAGNSQKGMMATVKELLLSRGIHPGARAIRR